MASSQTFQDHIHEFRSRLFLIILAIGVSATIAYIARDQVIAILQQPLGAPLFYSAPGGGFNFVVKLSMIIGMFVTLPVVIYQLIRFIEPALPFRIKRGTTLKIMGASCLLATLGILFGYFYIIPQSLKFFGGYSTSEIKPLISADSYLSYVINTLITFALAFQIPLFILFINWIKPLKPGKLLKYQRHVIVAAFGISVILPFTYDPISQFMVAVPIVVLFYLSVILLVIANRRKGKATKTIEAVAKPAPVARPPIATTIPIQATQSLQPRPRLSLDGMRGPTTNIRPQVAYARVKPAPSIQQQARRPKGRRLSIDGFYQPIVS